LVIRFIDKGLLDPVENPDCGVWGIRKVRKPLIL